MSHVFAGWASWMKDLLPRVDALRWNYFPPGEDVSEKQSTIMPGRTGFAPYFADNLFHVGFQTTFISWLHVD